MAGAWTRKEDKNLNCIPVNISLQDVPKACSHCHVIHPLSCFYTTGKKVDGSPKYNSWCKNCVKEKMASYHKRTWGPDRLQFSSYKRTKSVRSYLQYLRSKALHRKHGEDVVSLDYLCDLWVAQGGKCALTGWLMTMELMKGVVPTNCSLDRINSTLGYVAGNVQLVSRAANIAKHDLSLSDFRNLCFAVVETLND